MSLVAPIPGAAGAVAGRGGPAAHPGPRPRGCVNRALLAGIVRGSAEPGVPVRPAAGGGPPPRDTPRHGRRAERRRTGRRGARAAARPPAEGPHPTNRQHQEHRSP
ncbi:hypothetical protein BLA24_31910 [Streptomyces cinnamoneus]|uniref:Uncharacterized protein n=1 Tax=Streptomyces cinnamoneus TaxID=53446 RepID=A0A2G1X9Y9_STRCJ|nr:hypothetical protein [Streptomyces cinnamoneus]PHQ48057.1 hypothetical protein BLA24_31910 [Streptomyces cinnamoneus]PPT15683.1 hypothetical protein CYQ11_24965 [Streptomyces cinnamoneus]